MKAKAYLGIETSCDDTAVALITTDRTILFNEVYSQQSHANRGGVIPEIAAREHMKILPQMLAEALSKYDYGWHDIAGIAVTAGPGLIGPVLIGSSFAKGLSLATGVPCIPINHLEGHALTPRLTQANLSFPYLLLLISGGHCQLLIVHGVGKYKLLGQTLDDSLGESFDKIARLLKLGYPGGPIIEQLALSGDELAFPMPLPLKKHKNCDFSFSGLKTAVANIIQKHIVNSAIGTMQNAGQDLSSAEQGLSSAEQSLSYDKRIQQTKADIAASFQYTAVKILQDRLNNALELYGIGAQNMNYDHDINDRGINHDMASGNRTKIDKLVIAGGVAANQYIRNSLSNFAQQHGLELIVAPPKLCTDNAAMIAWVACEKDNAAKEKDNAVNNKLHYMEIEANTESIAQYPHNNILLGDLHFNPRARWPLEDLSEEVQ